MRFSAPVGPRTLLVLLLPVLAACPDPGTAPEEAPGEGPTAEIDTAEEVSVGLPTRVDGSGSSAPEGAPVTHSWTLEAPAGSAATLDDPTSDTPKFTPDVPGEYTLTLVVEDPAGDTDTETTTISAADNSTTTTVDETGGEAVSTAGRLRIQIPENALDSPIDLEITVISWSQVDDVFWNAEIFEDPDVSRQEVLSAMEFFDVQPAGQTFSIPAKASITLADAYAIDAGQLTASSGFMLDLPDGNPEPMEALTLAPYPADPTTGELSGEMDDLAAVAVAGGDVARDRWILVEGSPLPLELAAGSEFDVNLAASVNANFSLFRASRIAGATANDASVAPVVPDPSGSAFTTVDLLNNGVGRHTATADYLCDEAGTGTWVSRVTVESENTFAPLFPDGEPGHATTEHNVVLKWDVDCTAQGETTELDVSRAFWVSPGVADDEVLVGGTEPKRYSVSSGTVVPLGGSFGTEAVHHLYPLGSGLYANTVLGKSWKWTATDDWELIPGGVPDHALQFTPGADGTLRGASGLRAPRTVSSTFQLDSYAYNFVQAYWGDGTDDVLIITGGDGNAASNESFAAVADVASGSVATTLSGVMDVVLDQYQILARELACARLPADASRLVCLFTGGETSPGFLVNDQPSRDGYYELFTIDLSGPSATSLESGRVPTVGATAYSKGGSTWLTFMNQEANAVEVREVGATGLLSSESISLASSCTYPLDMTVTPSGAHAVAACWGQDGQGLEDDKYVAVEIP